MNWCSFFLRHKVTVQLLHCKFEESSMHIFKHQEYVHEAVQRTAQCVRALNEVKERQVGAQLMFQ